MGALFHGPLSERKREMKAVSCVADATYHD